MSAARKISRAAVGDPAIRPTTESFEIDKYRKQDDRSGEDMPFGARGGLAVRYYFPVDGDYVVKLFLQRTYEGLIRGLAEPHRIEVRLERKKAVKEFSVGGTPADTDGRPRAIGPDPEAEGAEVRFAAAGPARDVGHRLRGRGTSGGGGGDAAPEISRKHVRICGRCDHSARDRQS